MNDLTPIENQGQRVLTTDQLAELYGTNAKRINDNFKSNENKFTEEVHYFKLEGKELADFKNLPGISGLVGKNARQLMLWTRRGAARHSKMLGTDKAWDVFDSLEENYFNPQAQLPQTPEEKLALTMEVTHRAVENITKLDTRVTDLEQNVSVAPGEYNYISRQVNKAVSQYFAVHHMKLDNKQRALFYKDINRGLNDYIGIKTRTQLRKKDFDKADEFIANWQPSTATIMKTREVSLFDGQETE